jgi:hypothetical protein
MSEPIERVLLALDATAETRSAMDLAVRLAARAKVRLHAVFVEDEDLLDLANLPIAREVVSGAGPGSLTSAEVELQMRAAAARAQEELVVAARLHGLECSFEIVRGAAQAALAAASERDLVVASALARPVAGHFRVESRWLTSLELAPGSILLARDSGNKNSGVVALLRERGAGSARLLQTAARVAQLGSGTLTVICPPALAGDKDFAAWVDALVAPAEVRAQIEAAPGQPAALQARIAELGCGLLALDATKADRGELAGVARRFACDVLVAS